MAKRKEHTIKVFNSDTKADNFFVQYVSPNYYDGKTVIGCEIQYACKANNFKKTRIVIITG